MTPNAPEIRRARVEHARARLETLRAKHGATALVLSSVGAVAWATGGISTPIDRVAAVDPVWVVVRDEGATLIVSSVEVPRLSTEYDLAALGFDVVSAPWYQPDAHAAAVARVVGRSLSSCLTDGPAGLDVSDEVVEARLALCDAELDVLSCLARDATTAVEGALLAWSPGDNTDLHVAAGVQCALEGVDANAVCLIVGGDERVRSYRHPVSVGRAVNELLMVVVVARREGLHVALTRLAAVRPDANLEERLAQCDRVHASVLGVTRNGGTWGEAYRALGEGYREIGLSVAWREHFQGGPIGYAQREFELAPMSSGSPWWREPIRAGTAVAWNPSLGGGAKIEDTYVVEAGGARRLTDSGEWPRLAGPDSGAAVLVK